MFPGATDWVIFSALKGLDTCHSKDHCRVAIRFFLRDNCLVSSAVKSLNFDKWKMAARGVSAEESMYLPILDHALIVQELASHPSVFAVGTEWV